VTDTRARKEYRCQSVNAAYRADHSRGKDRSGKSSRGVNAVHEHNTLIDNALASFVASVHVDGWRTSGDSGGLVKEFTHRLLQRFRVGRKLQRPTPDATRLILLP